MQEAEVAGEGLQLRADAGGGARDEAQIDRRVRAIRFAARIREARESAPGGA